MMIRGSSGVDVCCEDVGMSGGNHEEGMRKEDVINVIAMDVCGGEREGGGKGGEDREEIVWGLKEEVQDVVGETGTANWIRVEIATDNKSMIWIL